MGGCGGGSGGRDGGGNLTQSCVLGMTSLGGRAEVRCLGIAFAAGIGGRNESRIPSFICRVMERSKSTAVSQAGPRVKASGAERGWGWG